MSMAIDKRRVRLCWLTLAAVGCTLFTIVAVWAQASIGGAVSIPLWAEIPPLLGLPVSVAAMAVSIRTARSRLVLYTNLACMMVFLLIWFGLIVGFATSRL